MRHKFNIYINTKLSATSHAISILISHEISSNPIISTRYIALHRLRNQFYYRSKTAYKKLNIEAWQNRDHKLSTVERETRTTRTTTTTTI